MFNWSNADEPVLVKLPFGSYWGVTGSITLLLIAGLFGLLHPEWAKAKMKPLKNYLWRSKSASNEVVATEGEPVGHSTSRDKNNGFQTEIQPSGWLELANIRPARTNSGAMAV
jgi:hypothetical protein